MWVANRGYNSVSKLRASDGKNLGTFSVPAGVYGVAFDGKHIWTAGDQGVTELRTNDGQILHFYSTPTTNTSGVLFDGRNVWVTGYNNNAAGVLVPKDGQ
jgi:hypothetical protein